MGNQKMKTIEIAEDSIQLGNALLKAKTTIQKI